jgi:hypothetical protein
MATLADLEASLIRLQARLAALATSDQVAELLASLNTYKSGTDTRINVIEGRLDTHDASIANLEERVQDLES